MPNEEVIPINETTAPIVEASVPIEAAPVVETANTVSNNISEAPVPTPEVQIENPTPLVETKPVEKTVLSQEPTVLTPDQANDNDNQHNETSNDASDVKTEGNQSDEPASLPTYEPFVLPEGITLEANDLGDFSKALGELETKIQSGKFSHEEMQAFGQALLDKYVASTQQTLNLVQEQQKAALEKQKADWLEAFKNDPEIGGNRQNTTANAAVEFIETHGGNVQQKNEIRQLLDDSGLGNHPALIRLFANAQKSNPEGRLLAANRAMPTKKSLLEKMYGTK